MENPGQHGGHERTERASECLAERSKVLESPQSHRNAGDRSAEDQGNCGRKSNEFRDGSRRDTVDYQIRDLPNVDFGSLQVDWTQIEAAAGRFNGTQDANINPESEIQGSQIDSCTKNHNVDNCEKEPAGYRSPTFVDDVFSMGKSTFASFLDGPVDGDFVEDPDSGTQARKICELWQPRGWPSWLYLCRASRFWQPSQEPGATQLVRERIPTSSKPEKSPLFAESPDMNGNMQTVGNTNNISGNNRYSEESVGRLPQEPGDTLREWYNVPLPSDRVTVKSEMPEAGTESCMFSTGSKSCETWATGPAFNCQVKQEPQDFDEAAEFAQRDPTATSNSSVASPAPNSANQQQQRQQHAPDNNLNPVNLTEQTRPYWSSGENIAQPTYEEIERLVALALGEVVEPCAGPQPSQAANPNESGTPFTVPGGSVGGNAPPGFASGELARNAYNQVDVSTQTEWRGRKPKTGNSGPGSRKKTPGQKVDAVSVGTKGTARVAVTAGSSSAEGNDKSGDGKMAVQRRPRGRPRKNNTEGQEKSAGVRKPRKQREKQNPAEQNQPGPVERKEPETNDEPPGTERTREGPKPTDPKEVTSSSATENLEPEIVCTGTVPPAIQETDSDTFSRPVADSEELETEEVNCTGLAVDHKEASECSNYLADAQPCGDRQKPSENSVPSVSSQKYVAKNTKENEIPDSKRLPDKKRRVDKRKTCDDIQTSDLNRSSVAQDEGNSSVRDQSAESVDLGEDNLKKRKKRRKIRKSYVPGTLEGDVALENWSNIYKQNEVGMQSPEGKLNTAGSVQASPNVTVFAKITVSERDVHAESESHHEDRIRVSLNKTRKRSHRRHRRERQADASCGDHSHLGDSSSRRSHHRVKHRGDSSSRSSHRRGADASPGNCHNRRSYSNRSTPDYDGQDSERCPTGSRSHQNNHVRRRAADASPENYQSQRIYSRSTSDYDGRDKDRCPARSRSGQNSQVLRRGAGTSPENYQSQRIYSRSTSDYDGRDSERCPARSRSRQKSQVRPYDSGDCGSRDRSSHGRHDFRSKHDRWDVPHERRGDQRHSRSRDSYRQRYEAEERGPSNSPGSRHYIEPLEPGELSEDDFHLVEEVNLQSDGTNSRRYSSGTDNSKSGEVPRSRKPPSPVRNEKENRGRRFSPSRSLKRAFSFTDPT